MNVEENRLKTFSEWPANAAVDAVRIAKAGFYYTGRGCEVQCFLCGSVISEWNYGDQAMARHRQAEPSCPFVQNPNATCNVPLIPPTNNSMAIASSSTEGGPTGISLPSEIREATAPFRSPDPKKEFGTVPRRLRSFDNWPKHHVASPDKLAKAGFYYLQVEDVVECAYCGCVIMNWTPTTDSDRLHREFMPKCQFYMHQTTNEDWNLHNVMLRPGTTEDQTELGIQVHNVPKSPAYATYEERLRTYAHWPESLRQTPEMLARAGFYYTGAGDRVRCFYCDIGLSNWEVTDDAWVEHAEWFPKCGYVNLVQGREFVRQCIQNRPPLDPAICEGVPEEEGGDVVETPIASMSTDLPPARELTDAALDRLLRTPPAMAALEIGLHVGRVKRAIKRRVQLVGMSYESADELMHDVLNAQAMEEDSSPGNQSPDSPSSELVNLLNHVTTQRANNNPAAQRNEAERTGMNPEISENRTITHNDMKVDESDKGSEGGAAITQPTKATILEEENRRLKEARLCKICMDWEVSVVFLPCGHLATCVYCAPSLTYCPMCRQEIRAVVRTFVS